PPDPEDPGRGESKRADQILADAGFNDRASEEVLVQSQDGRLTVQDPAFKPAIEDPVARLRTFRTVTEIKSPLLPQNQGQISRDGRSALVDFDIRGDADLAEERVDPILTAVAQLAGKHPQLRIEKCGEASADKAISKAFEDDFRKAETLSLPITLIILVLTFGGRG